MQDFVHLLQAYRDGSTGDGIFSDLAKIGGMPWEDEALTLDIMYYNNESGLKLVSPLVYRNMTGDPANLTQEARQKIAKVVSTLYLKSWQKLYEALVNAEYNPIDNYSMTETGKDTHTINETTTNTGTQEITNQHTDNDTTDITHGEVITQGGSDSVTVTHRVRGFNGEDLVDSDSDNTDTTYGRTDTHSGTDKSVAQNTGGGSDTRIDDLNEQRTGTNTTEHNLTRSGNIGVTTSQQMIESEIELRKKHFFDFVFRDIDRVLTIPIY